MTEHRDRLADALRALVVTPPASYEWFGRRLQSLPRDIIVAATPAEVRESLVGAVERELYRSFYTQGRPRPLNSERLAAVRGEPAFARALSEANAGVGGWQAGWCVTAWDGSDPIVARDGLAVRASAADCRPLDGALELSAPVSVRRPKELGGVSPGFYTALGDREPGGDLQTRVYFHVTARGAPALVAACTRVLNASGVPFVLKVVDRPGGFARCDAAVLYLDRDDFGGARSALADIVARCAAHLLEETPVFTKRLAPGVATGEHPAHMNASFGSLRSRLVAEGAVAATEGGAVTLEERVEAVAARFAAHGLDIDRPDRAPDPVDAHAS